MAFKEKSVVITPFFAAVILFGGIEIAAAGTINKCENSAGKVIYTENECPEGYRSTADEWLERVKIQEERVKKDLESKNENASTAVQTVDETYSSEMNDDIDYHEFVKESLLSDEP